eukprot:s6554_g1.t1
MILSQDADGMPFYLKQRWCVGEGQRLAWTKAGTLLAVVANTDKCFLFKDGLGRMGARWTKFPEYSCSTALQHMWTMDQDLCSG